MDEIEAMDFEKFRRAKLWHGTLTALAAISELPWARVWNLRSGRPVRIKPFLQGRKLPRGIRKVLGKAFYTSTDMENFILADRLLRAGIPGTSVQEILDKNIFRVGATSEVTPENLFGGTWIIVHDPTTAFPVVKFFPPEGDSTIKEALAHPGAWVTFLLEQTRKGYPVATISLAGLTLEVTERIHCFVERIPYKSAGQRVKEALEEVRKMKESESEASRLA